MPQNHIINDGGTGVITSAELADVAFGILAKNPQQNGVSVELPTAVSTGHNPVLILANQSASHAYAVTVADGGEFFGHGPALSVGPGASAIVVATQRGLTGKDWEVFRVQSGAWNLESVGDPGAKTLRIASTESGQRPVKVSLGAVSNLIKLGFGVGNVIELNGEVHVAGLADDLAATIAALEGRIADLESA